jgi:hypothetical protein
MTYHGPGHKAQTNLHNTPANHACQNKITQCADMNTQELDIIMPNRFNLLSTEHDSDKESEANDEIDPSESSISTIRQSRSSNLTMDLNKHNRKQRKKESQSTQTSIEISKGKAKTNNRKHTTKTTRPHHRGTTHHGEPMHVYPTQTRSPTQNNLKTPKHHPKKKQPAQYINYNKLVTLTPVQNNHNADTANLFLVTYPYYL